MGRIKLVLTEAESNKPVEAGTHDAEVEAISDPKTGPKASYVTATFRLPELGRKIMHNMPITGRGAGIFASAWEILTGEQIDIDNLDEIELDLDDAIGATCGLVIVHEEYPEGSGEMKAQVKKLLKS